MLRLGRTQERNSGDRGGRWDLERDPELFLHNEIIDRIERLAIGIGNNPCGHGKYVSLLEARAEHP